MSWRLASRRLRPPPMRAVAAARGTAEREHAEGKQRESDLQRQADHMAAAQTALEEAAHALESREAALESAEGRLSEIKNESERRSADADQLLKQVEARGKE